MAPAASPNGETPNITSNHLSFFPPILDLSSLLSYFLFFYSPAGFGLLPIHNTINSLKSKSLFPLRSRSRLRVTSIPTKPKMPPTSSIAWQQKRLHIFLLAAISVTILLFTVVHLRHFLPRAGRGRGHATECTSFYADDLTHCIQGLATATERYEEVGKEWL